jgi:hypothetical protein
MSASPSRLRAAASSSVPHSNLLQRALRKQSAKFPIDHQVLLGHLAQARYGGGGVPAGVLERGLVKAGFAPAVGQQFVGRGWEIYAAVPGEGEHTVAVMHLVCSILGVYEETRAKRIRSLHAFLAGKRGRAATFGRLRAALLPDQWSLVEAHEATTTRGEVARLELTAQRLDLLVREFPRFFDGIHLRYKAVIQHDRGDAWGEHAGGMGKDDAGDGEDAAAGGRSNAEILQQVMTKKQDGSGGNELGASV